MAAAVATTAPSSSDGPRYRALVVDDEPALVRVVAAYLERDGFEVDTATDGTEALRLAADRNPDVVVLDVMMPGVDGVDAESLARNRRTEQISLGAEFLDLIQNAENFRPYDADKMNPLEKDFFAYLTEIKKQAQDLVFQTEGDMGLTEESQKLNGIKRPGHIQEKTPAMPEKKQSQDPNL